MQLYCIIVGVSVNAIKSWISLLVSSDIILLLEPYYSNINKKVVKSPKIYFQDTGLCSYLTAWDTPVALERGAMSGAIFETFVVCEIIKSYVHNAKKPNIYYYRDKDKREIDVVIESNGKLFPIEIKKLHHPIRIRLSTFPLFPKKIVQRGQWFVFLPRIIQSHQMTVQFRFGIYNIVVRLSDLRVIYSQKLLN